MAAPKGNKHAKGNKGGGRKPLAFTDKMKEIAIGMARNLGATDRQLCLAMGISDATLAKWKVDDIEFFRDLKKAKELSDLEVGEALRHRALGYSHPDTKAQWVGDDDEGHWEYAELIKHYPPDPTAAIFWLKNRQPEEWRKEDGTIDKLTLVKVLVQLEGRDALEYLKEGMVK